jgi:hypothetical protein
MEADGTAIEGIEKWTVLVLLSWCLQMHTQQICPTDADGSVFMDIVTSAGFARLSTCHPMLISTRPAKDGNATEVIGMSTGHV